MWVGGGRWYTSNQQDYFQQTLFVLSAVVSSGPEPICNIYLCSHTVLFSLLVHSVSQLSVKYFMSVLFQIKAFILSLFHPVLITII